MPSLRRSTIAALRHRIVSGENGNMKGHPVGFPERLAAAQDAVVARCRLDRKTCGFEPADELADVFPHAVRAFGKTMSVAVEPTTDLARKERPARRSSCVR
jgi:hypothetical protein